MTVPPHGPYGPHQHRGHRPPPQWGPPPQQWGTPAGPPQQWGTPAGRPPQQWGTPAGPPPQQWGPPPQWGTPPNPNPAPNPTPPPAKGKGPLIAIALTVVAVLIVGAGVAYLFTRDKDSDSTQAGAQPSSGAPSTSASSSPTSGAPSPSPRSGSTPSSKSGSTPGAPAPAPAGGLTGYLLPASDLTERVKVTMSPSSTESGSAPLTTVTVAPANCTAAYLPASSAAYAGSGYTEIVVDGYRGPGNAIGNSVIQAVASFPDATAAKNFVNSQLGAWQGCKSTNVSANYADGASLPGKVGLAYQSRADTVTVDMFADLRTSTGCEHSITYQGNIVIDGRICTDGTGIANAGGSSTSLVHAIQRNIH